LPNITNKILFIKAKNILNKNQYLFNINGPL